jgi:hypothetical protein
MGVKNSGISFVIRRLNHCQKSLILCYHLQIQFSTNKCLGIGQKKFVIVLSFAFSFFKEQNKSLFSNQTKVLATAVNNVIKF